MADIAIKIDGIQGICTLANHANECDAFSIRETLELPTSEGGTGASGTGNRAKHSDIQVTRYRDKASPKLAEKLSAAASIGTVKIVVFKPVADTLTEILTYELEEAYISRMEYETVDQDLQALGPHINMTTSSQALPPSESGLAALLSTYLASRSVTAREAPRPVYGSPRGPALEQEIERIWFNSKKITWTYDPTGPNKVSKVYDLQTGIGS